jgi:type IV secretory pathway VirD2 relaxase
MSRRQNDPAGPVGRELRVAKAQLAGAISGGNEKMIRKARAAYYRALADDMHRRAQLVAAAAKEEERRYTELHKQHLLAELEKVS